jgi:hypothetical protein
MRKVKETILFQNLAPFRPFWENFAADLSGRLLFTRELLCFAAELSASWQPNLFWAMGRIRINSHVALLYVATDLILLILCIFCG